MVKKSLIMITVGSFCRKNAKNIFVDFEFSSIERVESIKKRNKREIKTVQFCKRIATIIIIANKLSQFSNN